MTRTEQLDFMIKELMPGFAIPNEAEDKWKLFRSLVNIRQPGPVSAAFLQVQDAFLKNEIAQKGITRLEDLEPIKNGIYLWQGDITTLAVDAIVNAANSGLTGCYSPCHGCIDNAIHTFAGVQLRNACAEIIAHQGYPEPTGRAKITAAYNLPSKFIIHTVGPIVHDKLTHEHEQHLAACYRSCLELADQNKLGSIAFCCISTGEFHFSNEKAARIALHEVMKYHRNGGKCCVIFNAFIQKDWQIYNRLLKK